MGPKKGNKGGGVLEPVFDDLCSRFIINCPDEELASFDRILFQVELAHWFYEDFHREANKQLPAYSLKEFARAVFAHCPLLTPHLATFDDAFSHWKTYKLQVPVCGCILVNKKLDKCLLVKGWYSRSSWGFPKGKINKDEAHVDCAVREVYEETGFDAADLIEENEFLEVTIKGQTTRLYIIPYIDEATHFAPRTRKEISKIAWHKLSELPTGHKPAGNATPGGANANKYFTVLPFVKKLKAWTKARRRADRRNGKERGAAGGSDAVGSSGASRGLSYAAAASGRSPAPAKRSEGGIDVGSLLAGPAPGLLGQRPPPLQGNMTQGAMPMPMPMPGMPLPMPMQLPLPFPPGSVGGPPPAQALGWMPGPLERNYYNGDPWLNFRFDMGAVMRALE